MTRFLLWQIAVLPGVDGNHDRHRQPQHHHRPALPRRSRHYPHRVGGEDAKPPAFRLSDRSVPPPGMCIHKHNLRKYMVGRKNRRNVFALFCFAGVGGVVDIGVPVTRLPLKYCGVGGVGEGEWCSSTEKGCTEQCHVVLGVSV